MPRYPSSSTSAITSSTSIRSSGVYSAKVKACFVRIYRARMFGFMVRDARRTALLMRSELITSSLSRRQRVCARRGPTKLRGRLEGSGALLVVQELERQVSSSLVVQRVKVIKIAGDTHDAVVDVDEHLAGLPCLEFRRVACC